MRIQSTHEQPGIRPDNTELIAVMEATIHRLDRLGEAALALAVREDAMRDMEGADRLTPVKRSSRTPTQVVIHTPMKVVIYWMEDGGYAVANVPRSYGPFDAKPDRDSPEAETRYFTHHAEALRDAKARHGGGAHVVDEARLG